MEAINLVLTYVKLQCHELRAIIPSEDPTMRPARQVFLEQAPTFSRDIVPLRMMAPTPLLPPSFLSPRSRPLSPRALEVEMRDIASAFYHSLHPSGTPPLLPIPLPAPSTSRRADIPRV
ncbi:hypothetical protein Tco_0464048 [Tanacetum coccineum]